MNAPWRLPVGLLLALVCAPTIAGQVPDPKTAFLQALRQFSLALEGAFGDEGRRIRAALDSMDQGLAQWDAAIVAYETAVGAELKSAEPREAAGIRVALGAIYLDRSRVDDALREFRAASQLDPSRADVQTLQGLAYSQLLNDPAAATQAFRQASALDPRDPVRAYELARHLMKAGAREEADQALHRFQDTQQQRAAEPGKTAVRAPFIRLSLVPEAAGVEPFFPPALYSKGFALLQQGDYPRAMIQFREAAARDPLTADAGVDAGAMVRAATAFRDGFVQNAIGRLNVAIELAPNHAEPHRILGLVFLADQQYDKGVDELRTAIRLDPSDERARLAWAGALADNRQYPAAEQALRETIEALPASGRAHYKLGRLYHWRGLEPEALHEFEQAATFHPLLGMNGLYQTMGAIYAGEQNFDGAIQAYSKRIDVEPNDPDAHQELGDMYVRRSLDDEATAEFAVALMLNPEHAEAHAAMGQLHFRAGRYGEAVEASRRALELDPEHKQARYALATSLMRLGRTEEGRQELQVFERLQAEATDVRSRQLKLDGLRREAALSSASGDYEKAVSLLREAFQYAPDTPAANLELGLALAKAGRPAEAIERFKAAVALNAPFEVHRHLAEANAALGQLDESRRELALYERMKEESLRRAGANK